MDFFASFSLFCLSLLVSLVFSHFKLEFSFPFLYFVQCVSLVYSSSYFLCFSLVEFFFNFSLFSVYFLILFIFIFSLLFSDLKMEFPLFFLYFVLCFFLVYLFIYLFLLFILKSYLRLDTNDYGDGGARNIRFQHDFISLSLLFSFPFSPFVFPYPSIYLYISTLVCFEKLLAAKY